MSRNTMGIHYTLVGTVDRRGYVSQQKALFVTPVDRVHRFDAYWSQFFAKFNWFVVFMSRLDAYISRYDDFCAHDNNYNNNMTNYFTPCACARGNECTGVQNPYSYIHAPLMHVYYMDHCVLLVQYQVENELHVHPCTWVGFWCYALQSQYMICIRVGGRPLGTL